ncbi:MAG: substrate-binding domain-containing protein [Dysgonomonas sp.]
MKFPISKILKWFIFPILITLSGLFTFLGLVFEVYQSFQLLFIFLVIILLLWGCVWRLRLIRKRIFFILVSSTTLIAGLTALGVYLHYDYINSIPVISDQGVDLTKYEPFTKESLTVALNEPSELKIEDNLPVIDGATALYPLYAAFVQATYPEKGYKLNESEIWCGTTPEAYNNLIEGIADLIFCAKPSDDQIEQAAKKGKTFKMTPIGREAFVFFVNKDNPVKELTTDQVRGIYSGKIKNWKELGGKNDEIKAYQRPKNSGSQTMLERIMGNNSIITPIETEMASGMGDIINYTADYKNYKNAIGYSFLFFSTEMVNNNQIEVIKIDGVYPSKETIKNGKYPFSGDFYAITTDTQNENVEKLIEWILSPQGQYLVEKTGYTSIR